MLNGLDLFSGIGGISLALAPWVRPIAYCENDRYAQADMLSRMATGGLPLAPIWDDIKTLSAGMLALGDMRVDVVYGGFPCQDISAAGIGRGLVGERSGLYWQIERLVKEIKPQFVFLENVPAIRTRGLNAVVQSLTELGYDCRWTVVSAAELGAPHLRKRWFLLANTVREQLRLESGRRRGTRRPQETELVGRSETLADNDSKRLADTQRRPAPAEHWGPEFSRDDWWSVEPELGRVAHGVPQRVDRLRGLGNAVVPLQARTAFMRLMGLEADSNAKSDRERE